MVLPDDGQGVSLGITLEDIDTAGLTIVEIAIVRFDSGFTPSGRFPVYFRRNLTSDPEIGPSRLGYDAAVCVQKYEPWIIETYNTSITSPSALQIVGKGSGSTLVSPSGNIRGAPTAGTRYLNTTNKSSTFLEALSNGKSRMSDINSDRRYPYKPSANVGPVVPPRTAFFLTLTYSTGHFFNRW